MEYLFQGTLWKKIDDIQENITKLPKKQYSTLKENKIILKNRKNLIILSPFALPSERNEHTIPIEQKRLKCLIKRSFRVTAHITNR